MNKLETAIMQSFKLAKQDIIQLQTRVIELSQAQQRILDMLNTLQEEMTTIKAKKPAKRAKSTKKTKKKATKRRK